MTAHITNCVYIVINANERNGFSVDNNFLGGTGFNFIETTDDGHDGSPIESFCATR